jgi:hypothetical protein
MLPDPARLYLLSKTTTNDGHGRRNGAAEDGVFNIPEGSGNYWEGGDRDGDGIACEAN